VQVCWILDSSALRAETAGWIVHHASLAPASSEVPGLTGWGIGIAMAALLGMGARRLER
jgi:hypothetical protein